METKPINNINELTSITGLPLDPQPDHSSHAVLSSVLGNSISTINAITSTPHKNGLGATNNDDPVAPPVPYNPAEDPDNNSDDGMKPSWLSGDPSNLPYSNIWLFPGDDLLSTYLRFLYDLKSFPGSLGMMNSFWETFANLSKSGKLNDPDFLKALQAGGGISSVLNEMVYVKALMAYHLNGNKLPDDFFSKLKADFSGNDPVSQALRKYIDDNADKIKGLVESKDAPSASQAWGDFVSPDAGQPDIISQLKKAIFMTCIEKFGNNLDLILMFLLMMKEADYDDQISGQGATANWIKDREADVKQIISDFKNITNLPPDEKSKLGVDLVRRLQKLKNLIDGSSLGKNLAGLIDPEISQILNIKVNSNSESLESFYNHMTEIDSKTGTPETGGWMEKLTADLRNNALNPSPANGGSSSVGDVQNALNSMGTALTDMGQTLAALMAQTTNLSKTQTNTAKDTVNNLKETISTAVKNQST